MSHRSRSPSSSTSEAAAFAAPRERRFGGSAEERSTNFPEPSLRKRNSDGEFFAPASAAPPTRRSSQPSLSKSRKVTLSTLIDFNVCKTDERVSRANVPSPLLSHSVDSAPLFPATNRSRYPSLL